MNDDEIEALADLAAAVDERLAELSGFPAAVVAADPTETHCANCEHGTEDARAGVGPFSNLAYSGPGAQPGPYDDDAGAVVAADPADTTR